MFINKKPIIFDTLYFQEHSITGNSVFPFWEPTEDSTTFCSVFVVLKRRFKLFKKLFVIFFDNLYVKSNICLIFAFDSVSSAARHALKLARANMGVGSKNIVEKDVYERYLRCANLAN